MILLLLVAAVWMAALHAWWVVAILLVTAAAGLYDLHLREREAERRRDQRCRNELRRREQAEAER